MILMKKIFKIAICSAFVLLPFGQVFAQNQSKHEISVAGGFGLSSLDFSIDNTDRSDKAGGFIGVGYNYFINSNFSINTGMEVTFYSSDFSMKSFTDSYKANDMEDDFLFNTSVANYKEEQSTTFINIPIMGQYQIPVMGDHKFYGALGAKIGIPVTATYKTSGATFETSGYYPDLGLVLDDQPQLGFDKFNGKRVKEDLDFKVAYMLAIEAGMKWALSSSLSLYTGAYFDYGLNDIRDKKSEKFLVYEPPYTGTKAEDFKLNSMLHSQYTIGSGDPKSISDKVIPFALGVKVKLAFSVSQ